MSVSVGELAERGPALRLDGPGLTRLCGAGLTFHGQGQNSLASTSVCGSSGPLPATLASPNAARFRAALTSRSRTSAHCVQTYVPSARASLAFTAPHPEQVLLDENHWSTTIVRHVPRQVVIDFAGVHDQQPTTSRRQDSLDRLRAGACEAVAVLNHDRRRGQGRAATQGASRGVRPARTRPL